MSNGHGLSESELALLTDEERAGLESGELDDDNDDIDDGEGGDDDDDDDDANTDDNDGGDDDDDTNANAGDENDDEDDNDDSANLSAITAADRIDVEATQSRIEAIATEQAALTEKLDDGEITTKEFVEANKALEREESELTAKVTRQTETDKAVTQAWFGDVEKFLDKNPELAVNHTRLQSFDTVVRRVTGDPEHANLSNRKQLELAHTLWREEMGITAPAKPGKTDTGQSGKPKPKTRAEIPPTLHNVPAADMSDSDDSKFAYLDGLMDRDPIGFEKALGALSEADQQDYLSRA